jgi:hypothetical protein
MPVLATAYADIYVLSVQGRSDSFTVSRHGTALSYSGCSGFEYRPAWSVFCCPRFLQYLLISWGYFFPRHITSIVSIYLSIYLFMYLYSPLLDLGRFFSFFILYTVGRTPWMGDQSVARPQHKHRINAYTDIHALSWVRTHDSSVWASEDCSCLTPRSHCDLPSLILQIIINLCSWWKLSKRLNDIFSVCASGVWGSHVGAYEANTLPECNHSPVVHRRFGGTYCLHLQCQNELSKIPASRMVTVN